MKHSFVLLLLFLTTWCAAQSIKYQLRASSIDENHSKKVYFTGKNYTYNWSEAQYDDQTNLPIPNPCLVRINVTSGDTLIKYYNSLNELVPWNYVFLDDHISILYVQVNDKYVSLYYQYLDSQSLDPIGTPAILMQINQVKKSHMGRGAPFDRIWVSQSEDFSKTITFCNYYNLKSHYWETKIKAYTNSWSNVIIDTIVQSCKNPFTYDDRRIATEVKITNGGTAFISGPSDYEKGGPDVRYGNMSYEIYLAKVTHDRIQRLEFPFEEKYIINYGMKVHNEQMVFVGTCTYGNYKLTGHRIYGSFVQIFDCTHELPIHSVDFPMNDMQEKLGLIPAVQSLFYNDVLFTTSDQMWLVTQNYWNADKEFICQLVTFEAILITTTRVFRDFSNQGLGLQEAYAINLAPYPYINYTILLKNNNLQIFYHDNVMNEISANVPVIHQMNFTVERYNLIMAEVVPEGKVTKTLIHTFNVSEPCQHPSSVVIYSDKSNYFLRCYTQKDKDLAMYTGHFTIND